MNYPIDQIQSFVGTITEQDLTYVELYIGQHLGLFIPSAGFCGYAIQHHTHPTYSFTVFPDEKSIPFSHGLTAGPEEYIVAAIGPHVPHTEEQQDSFIRYYAMFISHELICTLCHAQNISLPEFFEWNFFTMPKDILFLVNRFINECDSRQPGYEKAVAALETLIVNELLRHSVATAPSARTIARGDIGSVIEYMHQNYAAALTVPVLAGMAGMSQAHFSRTFRKAAGISPIQKLIEIRLEKAGLLLVNTSASITDISLLCGFSNAAHLSTTFKRKYHMTPQAYRSTCS